MCVGRRTFRVLETLESYANSKMCHASRDGTCQYAGQSEERSRAAEAKIRKGAGERHRPVDALARVAADGDGCQTAKRCR
jgi:hypothetical protein